MSTPYNPLARLSLAIFATASLSLSASATTVPPGFVALPVGYVSYDVTGTNVAQFDIVNLTGLNSSAPGDPSFPVTTSVSFSGLSLTVDYIGGGSHTFNSSYFTLDADGFSFDGKQLSTLSGSPTGFFGARDATLYGLFTTNTFTLNSGKTYNNVLSPFSASITDPSGLLADGDLAIITAAAASSAPEPASWLLLASGIIAVGFLTGARRIRHRLGCALALPCALLLLPAPSYASNAIKLSVASSPSSGTAGTGSVSITGSGFPSGTITPASVTVSLAFTCGGTPTTATPNLVTKIIGTQSKIQFLIPSSLSAGTYFISLSGTDSNSVAFSSGNCSTVQVLPGASPVLTIDTTNPADWKIANGALSIDFNTQAGNIFRLFPKGTTDNLIDQTQVNSHGPKGFYMDNAGVGAVTGVPGYAATGSYIDWWETYPSSPTNAYTYTEHFVVTPNDSGIHVYWVANHATTDIAGSIGQVQWVFRGDLNKFPNIYSVDPDLSNPGPIAIPLPSYAEYFSTDPGRAVQDASVDLHGLTDIPAGFTRNFAVKYDYSGYSYLNLAHGTYGSQYGAWVVFPSNESLVGGPTKQNLLFTGNLDMIEVYSNHLDNGLTLATPAGTASSRLFGPYYMRYNQFGGSIQTPADMYADAVAAGTSFTRFYDSEAQLLANGYVPSTARGTVQVQVNGVTANPKTSWAVLSDPSKNIQYSSQGAQYWADISNSGTAIFNNVIPGTYRLSTYVLGQFGELRQDGITVTANQTTVVPPLTFVNETFGTPIFTIGTPDRSAHEFLHGHDPAGRDDREFWGAWNYWADFQANSGAVVYNATDGPAGPATNNLNLWNYNHWQTFDPGLYGGVYNSADDTTDGYTYAIPTYVAALPGHTGTNGVTTRTPPWVVHFVTPAAAAANAYAILSIGLAATEASYTVSLNGTPLAWSAKNQSDAAVRSGLSGYYQWFAMQWDASVLKPVGQDNTLTISVSSTQGDMDDALRLELSNTSADPAVTGWHDYEFLYKTTDTKANDAVANP